jgi:DNA-binding beta-propeller fold protein YncE
MLLSGTALAHPSVSVVRDSRGNIFYSDLKQVWRIAPDGLKTVAVPNVHSHELALDSQDNLYGEHLWYQGEATDQWGHYVWRLGRDGKLARIIPAREGFPKDYSFVRDDAGNMYWAERGPRTTIRKGAPHGAITTLVTASFRDVRWMTATADGTIYLVDFHDLKRIDRDGRLTTVAHALSDRSLTQFHVGDRHALMGLWTDPAGNIYVANYASRKVKKVNPRGRVTTLTRSNPPWSPTGGLFAPNGDLWLLEYSVTNQVRLRRIDRTGRSRVY